MTAELAFTAVRPAEPTGVPVVAIAGDELWTCGARGYLAVSRDRGATWSPLETGTDADLHGVVRARDGAVWFVGASGFAARIVGERLERIALGTTADATGVHALDEEIAILASDGAIRRWRDGRIDVVHTGVTARLTGLAVIRHGTWIVVGEGGLVVRSPDGKWFARGQSGVAHDLSAVAATTDHRLIAVGSSGCVLVSSTEGRSWREMTAPDAPHLRSLAATTSGALIGGEGGLLLHLAASAAEPVIAPPPAAKPRIDTARVNAGLALSRRALALAPDDDEVQLAHAMLLVDVARLDELRAQLASFTPAVRARIEEAVRW